MTCHHSQDMVCQEMVYQEMVCQEMVAAPQRLPLRDSPAL